MPRASCCCARLSIRRAKSLPLLPSKGCSVSAACRSPFAPTMARASILAFVATTVEAVSPLGHADAALASGTPFLTVAEPALLLLAPTLNALGGAVGDADALDALGFGSGLVLAGIEGRVGSDEVRRASKRRLMDVDRRNKQIGIVGPLVIDLEVDHDLVLGLLQLHQRASADLPQPPDTEQFRQSAREPA